MKLPNIFLKYFIGMVSLQIGVSMLTGMYTMLALLMLMINGAEFQYRLTGDHFLLVTMILLLFLTWLIAFFGAYISSMDVIQYALCSWTIFIAVWLAVSVIAIFNNDKTYCVANKSRCPPSLWLYENETDYDIVDDGTESNITDDDINITPGGEDEDHDETTPGISEDDVPTTENESPSSEEESASPDSTGAPSSVETEKPPDVSSSETPAMLKKNIHTTSMTIFVKNTSPLTASNLITRVIKNTHPKQRRKSMTTMNKNIVQTEVYYDGDWNELSPLKSCSTKSRKIKLQDREPNDIPKQTTEENDSQASLAKTDVYKYMITMSYYLTLFLYSWYVLISYFVELKCIKDCICHQHSPSVV